MKLDHNWTLNFIDAGQRVVLTKPGKSQDRNVYYRFEFPFLKTTDKHGNPLQDRRAGVPPSTKKQVMAACKERWA